MPNRVKGKVRPTPNSSWNSAISEASRQLALAKRRVEGLEKAVKNWTKLRDDGIPWPGAQSEDHS
jgi:hypothetical protein